MRWPWRRREPVTLDNYHDADDIRPNDPAWQLLFGRVMETGNPHVATRGEDGEWTVREVPPREE